MTLFNFGLFVDFLGLLVLLVNLLVVFVICCCCFLSLFIDFHENSRITRTHIENMLQIEGGTSTRRFWGEGGGKVKGSSKCGQIRKSKLHY